MEMTCYKCVYLGVQQLIIVTCEYLSTSHPMNSAFNLVSNKKGENNGQSFGKLQLK